MAGENAAESAVMLHHHGEKPFHMHFNDNYRTWNDDMIVGSLHFVEHALRFQHTNFQQSHAGALDVFYEDRFFFKQSFENYVKESPMSSLARSLIALAVLFLVAGAVLRADVLTLANGDKLKGKLVKNVDGLITFNSDILGEIIVATTKASVEVDLTPEQKAALAKAEEEKKKAAAAAATAKKNTKKPKPTTFVPYDLRTLAKTPERATKVDDTRWINRIDVGLVSQRGRTDKLDISVNTENNRRTLKTETRFLNNYIYAKTADERTADKLTSNLRFRRTLTDKTFFQSNTRYTRDKPNLLNTDAEQGVGLGRNLYARKTIVIAAGADVAVRYRSYMNDLSPNETTTVFDFFQDLTLTINSRFSLTQDFIAVVNPENNDDQKYNFTARLIGKITNTFNITTRVEIEYDKHREKIPDDLRYYQRITTSLGYVF